MIKKTVKWVCGLVFVAALSFPAFADQSIGYRQYYNEGVIAFKKHDDQKALRCFIIAHLYDPADKDLNRYLSILDQRGVILELHPSQLPPERTIGFRYYFSGGIKAFQEHNDKKAILYFKIALIFNPASKESQRYLKILYQRQGLIFLPENLLPQAMVRPKPYTPPVQPQPYTAPVQPQAPPAAVVPQLGPLVPAGQMGAQIQPAPMAPAAVIYVPAQKVKQSPVLLSLSQITNNGQIKARLQMVLYSSVIIEGKNIQRFLVVNERFIGVKKIDANRLEVHALAIGSTFLHIWDDFGRHTIFVEVVFPKSIGGTQGLNVLHALPFRFIYSNDWNTFYSGKNIPQLKRQSYELTQSLAVNGETPYGFFDSSGSYTNFNTFSQFDTYTIGLSQIPLEGTSNFNLRGFDAARYLSPLTMPTTQLRGVFADVDLMGDLLGLSLSHGQEQLTPGFIAMGGNTYNNSYIDAAKLTLFPKSDTDRYSFNFATAYGHDRIPYLSDHVYSIQGLHRFNDYLSLNAEQASDSSHESTLASLKWEQEGFKSHFNFRNIDKNYSTISTLPADQGETGAAWSTSEDFKNISASTYVEAYRDHLNFNPDNRSALNYDGFGQARIQMTKDFWSDSDINFMDNPGESSPQRNFGVHERLSKSFGIWNSLKGTVFGGVGYQNSHSSVSNISNYDREDVIAGIQLPLTNHLSTFANYEYDWLNQPESSGGHSDPSVINAGIEYEKPLNSKVSFNSQLTYRDELGVKPNEISFLSGEESVIISGGLTYNPTPDVSIFADCDASKIWSHVGNPSYDDFEAHLGVRITFGGGVYWDPLGTVSGIVYKDMKGEGKYVSGDEGIPDVKVKVGDKETITDKHGRYHIQVRAKGVFVTPVLDTVPGGLIFSTPQTLLVNIIQGRTSHADFGLISQTGIYGIVFVDIKGTGIPSEGDQFIRKVKVVLDGKITQKSDLNGSFYFRKVSPGAHTLTIDINTLALDMVPLVKLTNRIDVAEGTNYVFNIPLKIKKAQDGQD